MDAPESAENAARTPRLPFRRMFVAAMLAWPIALSSLPGTTITEVYFKSQDRWLLVVLVFALIALTYRAPRWSVPDRLLPRWSLLAGLAAMVLLLWWGTYALMANYPLTRDEHMVLFDMAVFGKGHLLEPVAQVWRGNPKALVPDFLLDVPGSVAFASGYLPGNAMLRLAFSRIADPALMNPVFAAIGALALLDVARRLFGQDRRAIIVVLALYLGSAQLLVNAMTVYAMTGHTALNLVWLALFLRGGKAGHAGAMAISLLAMGLHQVVFHPMFAAPFLLWLIYQRRFGLGAIYVLVFAAGGLFWILYPAIAIHGAGIAASGGSGDGISFLRDRVWPLLVKRDPGTLVLMALNLIRFVVWQHLALVPLLVFAGSQIRRNTGIAAPLAGGIVLTLAFCGFILPLQGHGWGYRYFAGVFGNFALLGALGYREWAARDRASADGVVMALSALTAVFMVLAMAWAQRFVAPQARLDRRLSQAPGDLVLIDTEKPGMAIDQVRNLPDLSNRPIRLSSRALDASAIAQLCASHSLSVITRRDMQAVGFALEFEAASPVFEAKVSQALAGKSCLQASPPAARR